jgi:biopolymer transport protein ExbB
MAFAFSRSITIDHTKCGTVNSSNFTALVSLSDNSLRSIGNSGHVQNSNGYDILFYSDSLLTARLPAERVSYNASTGACVFWVKVATLTFNADTVFYMAYGDAGVPGDPNLDATYGKTSAWDTYTQPIALFQGRAEK